MLLMFRPFKADSIRPTPFNKPLPHLIKRDKTIPQRIRCYRRIFKTLGLGFSAKRFFNGLADERIDESLLCRLQKQQLPL